MSKRKLLPLSEATRLPKSKFLSWLKRNPHLTFLENPGIKICCHCPIATFLIAHTGIPTIRVGFTHAWENPAWVNPTLPSHPLSEWMIAFIHRWGYGQYFSGLTYSQFLDTITFDYQPSEYKHFRFMQEVNPSPLSTEN